MIVNTFKRPDLLRKSVQHYSQCPAVRRVHVNWAESVTPARPVGVHVLRHARHVRGAASHAQ